MAQQQKQQPSSDPALSADQRQPRTIAGNLSIDEIVNATRTGALGSAKRPAQSGETDPFREARQAGNG